MVVRDFDVNAISDSRIEALKREYENNFSRIFME
jgi:hypothetical protein